MKISWLRPIKYPVVWLFAGQILLLSTALMVYWPGLKGPFLFDDFANIDALGAYGGVVDWESLKLFVLGNHSGTTGRPVAMLSFLLNDFTWPSIAFSFKYTNLMLHLLNGLLLYTLVYQILLNKGIRETQTLTIALLTSGVWLLHPLNVSTVLYPVQRMAILATLFVLLGLVGYVSARRLIPTRPRTAYLLMSLSLAVGSLFAVLSKENGALLPLLAWVLEFSVLSRENINTPDKRWQSVFFWLPTGLLIGYFLYLPIFGNLSGSYASRSFTLSERLLTEPRILFDYLYYWFIPQAGSPGLLTQDFPVSTGLLSPPTTVISIIGLAAIITLAFRLRRHFPLFTLAVLFYFTGHLLESTLIPLELYFEHRNYLPGLFLAVPLAAGIGKLPGMGYSKLTLIFLFAILLIPAAATVSRVSYWESEETLAYHWAQVRPDSQRAQRYAALVAQNHGKWQYALDLMQQAKLRHPDRIAVHLHWLTLSCRFIPLTVAQKSTALETMEKGQFSFRNTGLLESTTRFIASDQCLSGGRIFSHDTLNALAKNPVARHSPGARHQLHHIRGLLLLSAMEYEKAAKEFQLSLQEMALPQSGMLQISLLASAGKVKLALAHLNFVSENVGLAHKTGELDFREEIDILRATLTKDILGIKHNITQ